MSLRIYPVRTYECFVSGGDVEPFLDWVWSNTDAEVQFKGSRRNRMHEVRLVFHTDRDEVAFKLRWGASFQP